MTGVDERVNEHDLETPDSIQVRFGIEYVESRPPEATAVLSMQMHRFRNPLTGAPTVGPLAIPGRRRRRHRQPLPQAT